MREYARITGLPEMPARWTFGYHAVVVARSRGPEEILGVARTFREKKLPCDALIYLGTEFAPSGWNTRNGEFTWHPTNFPDPKEIIDALHAQHFKVVVHVVIEGRRLTGRVADPCTRRAAAERAARPDDRWPPDRQVAVLLAGAQVRDGRRASMAGGPTRAMASTARRASTGTACTGKARSSIARTSGRSRSIATRRPASSASAASSGRATCRAGGRRSKTHVAVAINTGLSGLPYWGTDIGGFNPTAEYTGELHVRWFQFGAFCPLFRAHGRNWHLQAAVGLERRRRRSVRDGQLARRAGGAAESERRADLPQVPRAALAADAVPLHGGARVHETGLPIMRALWLHHPDDATAVARGDEYFWGRDMLVAPVVEKGATSRTVYLPRGDWFDFWTERARRRADARSIAPVDLATMPLYVRAGAVLPLGPVKQYADEPIDEPLTLVVYPGADGTSSLYEDDGRSFDYQRGAWMRIAMGWRDATGGSRCDWRRVQGCCRRLSGASSAAGWIRRTRRRSPSEARPSAYGCGRHGVTKVHHGIDPPNLSSR